MFAPVYLDYNATTPMDEAVRDAMLPWLGARFGNPSSRHEYGRQARAAIDLVVRELEAGSIRDMGRVMGALKARYMGQMDFSTVGPLVKARLTA